MSDLSSAWAIKMKGLLFLFGGVFAATLLVTEDPTLQTAFLLAMSVWCFCRFYYFAFYVIERYVDPTYRFSGLWSFARYLLRRSGKTGPSAAWLGKRSPSAQWRPPTWL